MRFLIVGFSSIVARRALPALLQLPDVESIDIASRRPLERTSLPDNWSGKIYDDYREAISNSQAEVVYVSLVNSLHEEWVAIALRSEKHVIVDKPAFLSLAAAVQLIEIATKNDLCLAEAVVFSYHPPDRGVGKTIFRDWRHNPAHCHIYDSTTAHRQFSQPSGAWWRQPVGLRSVRCGCKQAFLWEPPGETHMQCGQ